MEPNTKTKFYFKQTAKNGNVVINQLSEELKVSSMTILKRFKSNGARESFDPYQKWSYHKPKCTC